MIDNNIKRLHVVKITYRREVVTLGKRYLKFKRIGFWIDFYSVQ